MIRILCLPIQALPSRKAFVFVVRGGPIVRRNDVPKLRTWATRCSLHPRVLGTAI